MGEYGSRFRIMRSARKIKSGRQHPDEGDSFHLLKTFHPLKFNFSRHSGPPGSSHNEFQFMVPDERFFTIFNPYRCRLQ
jgi:hypothetical protein